MDWGRRRSKATESRDGTCSNDNCLHHCLHHFLSPKLHISFLPFHLVCFPVSLFHHLDFLIVHQLSFKRLFLISYILMRLLNECYSFLQNKINKEQTTTVQYDCSICMLSICSSNQQQWAKLLRNFLIEWAILIPNAFIITKLI